MVVDFAVYKKIDHQNRHLGGAFEGGWDFEQLNLQKVRMPWDGLPWGEGNVEALN